MTPRELHARYEKILATALRDPDPAAAIAKHARNRAMPRAVRDWLSAMDVDGIRISALLVARLRFERLLRGSPDAASWFERDPAAFAAAFRRYHHEVAPVAFFPGHEARLFALWRS